MPKKAHEGRKTPNLSETSNRLAGAVSRQTRYACRLLCCVPPFACAFAFPSLAKALGFAGVCGSVLPMIVTPDLNSLSAVGARQRAACEAIVCAAPASSLAPKMTVSVNVSATYVSLTSLPGRQACRPSGSA